MAIGGVINPIKHSGAGLEYVGPAILEKLGTLCAAVPVRLQVQPAVCFTMNEVGDEKQKASLPYMVGYGQHVIEAY